MKRKSVPDAIDFPANPFVALSDFVMVILLLVVLGFVYQSVSSNRFLERVAVENAQSRLFRDLTGEAKQPGTSNTPARQQLIAAYQASPKRFNRVFVDGDLQRFWFDGALLYQASAKQANGVAGSGAATDRVASNDVVATPLSPEGRRLLIGFGEALNRYQGDLNKPGTGLFKRIIVQGNADRSEGDDNTVWALSLSRAREAAQVLQNAAKVSPLLIEPSGRGCWNPRELPSSQNGAEQVAKTNRRLEIVVVYSAPRAAEYEKKQAPQSLER